VVISLKWDTLEMPREGGGWLGSGATALMEKEDRCQEMKHVIFDQTK